MTLDKDIAKAMRDARRACTDRGQRDYARIKQRRSYGPGHNLDKLTDAAKRELYEQACRGQMNIASSWQRFALREDVEIGVWLYFYHRRAKPPTDDECRRAWGGELPPKLRPVPRGGKPLPPDVEVSAPDTII